MIPKPDIPYPLLFNPLKHHLTFIKEYVSIRLMPESKVQDHLFHKELKHLGSSVMDIYTGNLTPYMIYEEVIEFLKIKNLLTKKSFSSWAGKNFRDFRIHILSDSSMWTLKYHESESRFVHLFPARYSPHTFRIKANTLKTAILYLQKFRNEKINEEDLNIVRSLASLSPIKSLDESIAIVEMINILR